MDETISPDDISIAAGGMATESVMKEEDRNRGIKSKQTTNDRTATTARIAFRFLISRRSTQ